MAEAVNLNGGAYTGPNVVEDPAHNVIVTAEGDTIYNYGYMEALKILLPAAIGADYISQINFTSLGNKTELNAPIGVIWYGDDIDTLGVFVPESYRRYTVMLYSDGVNVIGIVRGTEINQQQS